MKLLTVILGFILSSSIVMAAGTDWNERNNSNIVSCTKKTSDFFRNVQLDGTYYRGANKYGACFISVLADKGSNRIITFLNSKNTTKVASIEIGTTDKNNATGITSEIKQCSSSSQVLAIESKYRMPRTIYYHANGGISRSLSIFDIVEYQSVQFKKDSAGKLVSASFKINNSTQDCYFK